MKKFLSYSALALALTAASVASHVNAQEKAAEASKAEAPKATEAPPVPKAVAAAKPVREASPKVRPLSVSVDLLSNTEIVGTLTDITNLDMQTSFGTANIPLSEVAGIRFASAEDASTTVVMLNGDSITGATDVKLVTVETEWGVAAINGQSVQSIMFVPNVVWNPNNGLNGKRWSLVSEKLVAAKEAPAPAPAPAPVAAQPNRTTNTGVVGYPNATYSNGQPVYRNGR